MATDTPLKALTSDPASLSMADRASVAASGQASKEGVLCGQLYCARADALRKIWLPPALPVEDGFLGAMIKTSGFTSADDFGRIAWVSTARHFFRTHRSVGGYLAHEARIIAGSTINSWLFAVLWEKGREGHAGAFVEARCVDEVIGYLAPVLLGAGPPVLGDAGITTLADAVTLDLQSVQPLGTDVKIVARPRWPEGD